MSRALSVARTAPGWNFVLLSNLFRPVLCRICDTKLVARFPGGLLYQKIGHDEPMAVGAAVRLRQEGRFCRPEDRRQTAPDRLVERSREGPRRPNVCDERVHFPDQGGLTRKMTQRRHWRRRSRESRVGPAKCAGAVTPGGHGIFQVASGAGIACRPPLLPLTVELPTALAG